MKPLLALVLLTLFSSPLKADTVASPLGPITIPDGSTVTTGVNFFLDGGFFPAYEVGFSFLDGNGDATLSSLSGWEIVTLDFTTPLTTITLNWFAHDNWFFEVFNAAGIPFAQMNCDSNCATSGSTTFTGPISQIFFHGGFFYDGGIDSMSYVVDQPVSTPEPATLRLLLTGILLPLAGVPLSFFGRAIKPRTLAKWALGRSRRET